MIAILNKEYRNDNKVLVVNVLISDFRVKALLTSSKTTRKHKATELLK